MKNEMFFSKTFHFIGGGACAPASPSRQARATTRAPPWGRAPCGRRAFALAFAPPLFLSLRPSSGFALHRPRFSFPPSSCSTHTVNAGRVRAYRKHAFFLRTACLCSAWARCFSPQGVLVLSLGTSGTLFCRSAAPVLDPSGAIAPFMDAAGARRLRPPSDKKRKVAW